MSKLYVGNLSYTVTEQELEDFFSSEGKVVSVKIIKDRDTGQAKGFGFVEMETPEAAEAVISKLNGQDFKGRAIRISEAREKPRGEGGGFRGGRGGGGGFRGGRGGGGGFRREGGNHRGGGRGNSRQD